MSTVTETIIAPPTPSLKLTTTASPPQEMSSTSQVPSHPTPSAPKSQKQMTKAERREQQEAQRAAKAAAKSAAQPAASHKRNASASGKGTAPPAGTPKKSGKESTTKPGKGEPKEALHPSAQPDETPRGLRIFSHFGAPKPPIITKGDIHPAVIRLGLQFAEFKVTGANARCIAMLSAFKTVRLFILVVLPLSLTHRSQGHPRLRDASEQYPFSSSHDASLPPDHTPCISETNVSLDGQCN